MSRNDANQWTAEQTLSYINGLIAAQDNQDEEQYNQTLYTALSISYEYLTNATKRKITWSLSLQKLAYEFIELAFETNMHVSIKDVFKSYRAITQGQYSQSLKYVLEHYRDKKLQTILEEDISSADLAVICSMSNIEIEQPSPELILESLHPDVKQRLMQIRSKLKIVWEGYKCIIETVRVNQKLEDVYMTTLNKIFDFVERYNRVQEFKNFCKSLRTGLQTAFNKRDRAQQQKAIYIDIQKTDVNTRNIEIRMEQFRVTTKLGLWSEAFQALEDIKNIMKVRRAPIKNSLKCQYFENLALLFKKNNFWHYHSFAYYNYYTSYLTKPKITTEEKRELANKLLLAILAIPAVPLESTQSKEIQEKVCGMMLTSNKVPSKNQLVELMVSRGVLENASETVSNLWNFMFLQFGVTSLQKGLELVSELKDDYAHFRELIEATLINRQLLSIAEVYQRIRITSLQRLIPLPLQKIKRILILAHHQKILSYTFDESQGIIIFEDQTHQINPSEEFHELFVEIALAYESERKADSAHILHKAEDYLQNADHNIWTIRQYKIEQFKKKMKKPMFELRKQGMLKQKQERELREHEQNERRVRESEAIKKGEELQRILATKKIIIGDIISIKEQRIVRIMQKKIEHLTDEEIDNLTVEVLQQHLETTRKKITNNKEARLKKIFTHIDYLERERRQLMNVNIKSLILSHEQEEKIHEVALQASKNEYEEHREQQAKLQNLALYYKGKIEKEVKQVHSQFDHDMEEFKNRVNDNFKKKVLARALDLFNQNELKKKQQLKLKDEINSAYAMEDPNAKWGFMNKRTKNENVGDQKDKRETSAFAPFIKGKNMTAPVTDAKKTTTETTEKKDIKFAPLTIGKKRDNIFENLSNLNDDEIKPRKQVTQNRTDEKWNIGAKKTVQEKKQVTEVAKKQAEQVVQKAKEVEKKAVFAPPPPINPVPEKKGKWVNANEPIKTEKKQQPKVEGKKMGKRF